MWARTLLHGGWTPHESNSQCICAIDISGRLAPSLHLTGDGVLSWNVQRSRAIAPPPYQSRLRVSFSQRLLRQCHSTREHGRYYAAVHVGCYRHGFTISHVVSRALDMHGIQSDLHAYGSIGGITLDEGCCSIMANGRSSGSIPRAYI
jgi:hypothetical protein